LKSFSILRTNVGLTTNVKVICDSEYKLYLESIDSAPELSISRLKKLQFNKNNFYDELIPYFFKDFPSDIAYHILYSNDNDNMSLNFSNQYDDIYQMGAKNIIDNKNYQEEYEFLAPLYIFKNSIPKQFIIFRIDGPGLINLNSKNFRSEFLQKLKTVKVFDLTKKTPIGEWIDLNFTNNKSYPDTSLEIDFRNLEFSKWIGIDYNTGGFTYKSRFLETSLENENTIFDFEKLFFDGYKTNKIIHPQIINFSFLFDDIPATPISLRKWSLNRYTGFYIDNMDLIDTITPFKPRSLKPNIEILEGNELYCNGNDPFILGFKDDEDMWVEYLGNFYKVEKYVIDLKNTLSYKSSKNPTRTVIDDHINKTKISKSFTQETIKVEEYLTINTTKYRIVSELNLEGKEALLNKKTCYINSENQILKIDGSTYSISGFENADINLIEIDGKYHNIILDNGYLKINSDYGFNLKENYRFEYYINSPNPDYYKYIDLSLIKNVKPINFKIFSLNLTDIKDFDTQIIDNEFSKYEYEKIDSITETEEPKMYTTDLRSLSNPATFNDYIYKDDVVLVPCSSDYIATLEPFRINNNELTDLWRKNSTFCRFGYQNSISNSDYIYLLNNNDIHENFNRTADTIQLLPSRKSRNLDYFYSINSGTTSYLQHSLHIEKNYGSIQDLSFRFELDKYLNIHTYSIGYTYSSDYFKYLFGSTQSFLNGKIIKNVSKYSYFESGNKSIPNISVFRGLKFKLFEVDNIKKNEISIDNINLLTSSKFNEYKLSILLSQNLQEVDDTGIKDSIIWGYFLNSQYNNGNLAFRTSNTTSPANIKIGDIVEIKQNYPYSEESYNGLMKITYIGPLDNGGYGFETDKTFISEVSINPGYFKVNVQWVIIKNWEHDVQYYTGDIIIYEYILYNVKSDNIISNPSENPSNLTDYYGVSSISQPFWNPNGDYKSPEGGQPGDWCFRQGDFYFRNENSLNLGIDFWRRKDYSIGEVVSWKGRYYKCVDNTVSITPNIKSRKSDISDDFEKYWKEVPNPRDWYVYGETISDITINDLWNLVPVWNDDDSYILNNYVINNNILYLCIIDETIAGDEPGKSENWERIYGFDPESNFAYSPLINPIIKFGETYYMCTFNRDLYLNSGITIYINKKWKNILINISINDNTTPNIDGYERDLLYQDLNYRLTAANFIRQLNDLDSKYDFSEYTSYVIIEEDGSFKKYNFDNIEELPYFLLCEEPDSFELNNNTISYSVNTLSKTQLKPLKYLVNGTIDSLDKLNYYNDIPLGCEINRISNEVGFGYNYNGRTNITISKNATVKPKSNQNISDTFYRHSGYYMPIFYNIELFKSSSEFDTKYGNYKFDESLSLFGIMKQRVISKINRKENILKLRDQDSLKSIYPMVDEFGYTVIDFFIFKSTWDYAYHVECERPIISSNKMEKLLSIDNIILSEKNSKE